MPRRNLTEKRTGQILDALERCIVQHGLSGASLELVAQEAGVQRSILRHYVGNRDDIVLAMASRFAVRYQNQLNELSSYASGGDRIERVLSALFASPTNFHDVLLVEALIAAAETNAAIKEITVRIVESTIDTIRNQLRAAFPDADSRSAWCVAYGVVGIWFNHDSLVPLSLSPRHTKAARESARRLIETLS